MYFSHLAFFKYNEWMRICFNEMKNSIIVERDITYFFPSETNIYILLTPLILQLNVPICI